MERLERSSGLWFLWESGSSVFQCRLTERDSSGCSFSSWNLRIGNGVGKQGRGNQPPYRRHGPDTEIQYQPRKPHGLSKPRRIFSQRKPIRNVSINPTPSIRTSIADAVFADAISETPMENSSGGSSSASSKNGSDSSGFQFWFAGFRFWFGS